MCRTLLVATGTALIAVSFGLPAAAVEMQPGRWELTTKVERDGAVSTRRPRSRCISRQAANAARDRTDLEIAAIVTSRPSAPLDKDACKVTDVKNSQDLMTWRLQCTGSPSVEQQVTTRFENPRHYVLVIRTSMTVLNKTSTSVLTTEGRHTGECPP